MDLMIEIGKYVGLTVAAGAVAFFNSWAKEQVLRRNALKELQANPFCRVGAVLREFRSADGDTLMGRCRVADLELGNVTLVGENDANGTPGAYLLLTCQEYKAGYALYDEAPPVETIKIGRGTSETYVPPRAPAPRIPITPLNPGA